MKRILLNIIYIFFVIIFLFSKVYAEDSVGSVTIKSGSFVKAMVQSEFSTLTSDIGDEVTFINTQDMYIYETNAIPENSIFYGEIEDLKEPVQGKDGSLKISIYKIITPDKKVYRVKAHIYGEDNNYIGGKNTESIYYHRVPHYIRGFRPYLQAAPLNIYEMGQHTVVKPGAELFIIFDDDVIIK